MYSLRLEIRLTPSPQPLLLVPGIILYLILLFAFHLIALFSQPIYQFHVNSPVNYFDYDTTFEPRNAILIHPLQERDVFEFDDNGEKQNFHCLPDGPPVF